MKQIGVINAGFSALFPQITTGVVTNVLTMVKLIARDFSDGIVDGMERGVQLVVPGAGNLSPTAASDDLVAAIQTVQSNPTLNPLGPVIMTAQLDAIRGLDSAVGNIVTVSNNIISVRDEQRHCSRQCTKRSDRQYAACVVQRRHQRNTEQRRQCRIAPFNDDTANVAFTLRAVRGVGEISISPSFTRLSSMR